MENDIRLLEEQTKDGEKVLSKEQFDDYTSKPEELAKKVLEEWENEQKVIDNPRILKDPNYDKNYDLYKKSIT